jgi:hypothetical protein
VIGAMLAVPAVAIGLVAPVAHVGDGGFRREDDPARYVEATLGRVPPGPALYLAESDHALFPAQYERLVAGDRPDVAIGNRGLCTSSWFLAMIDREVPELFVPYVDDGGDRRALAARLVGENLGAGRPVVGELPPPDGQARALGLVYRYGATGPDVAAMPPPRYQGALGRAIAMFTGATRAEWEARHGRWRAALVAAGADDRFDAAALAAVDAAQGAPLWPELPVVTPVFIAAPWQPELIARDAAFAAGLGPGPAPPPGAPVELRLLHAWHLLFAGDPHADAALAALGPAARLATARVCEKLGRPDDAEAQATAALAAAPRDEGAALLLGALQSNHGKLADAEATLRAAAALHPKSARARAALGLVLAKLGRLDEARAAWQNSLALDPRQPDVRAWLDAGRAAPTP